MAQDNKNIAAVAPQVNDNEVEKVLQELNLTGEENATPSRKVARDDEFTIVGIRKVNETAENNFCPMVFDTNIGTAIGTKHFSSLNIQPAIGKSTKEAVAFALAHKKAGTKFLVTKVRELDEKELPNGDKYTPREFTLEVI